jgi:lactate dehydrogenase-like 2-hydroxyacid dehydrogenase
VQAIVHAGEVKLSHDLLAEMPRLGLIACVSVGYDGVDVPWCRAHGVAVSHSQGLNADDVADHAVGAFIAAWRGIVTGDRMVREDRWTPAGADAAPAGPDGQDGRYRRSRPYRRGRRPAGRAVRHVGRLVGAQ